MLLSCIYKKRRRLGVALSFTLLVVLCNPTHAWAGRQVLDIVPIPQYTTDWCWLAALEMIFKYNDIPNGIPPELATNEPDRDFQMAIVAKTDPKFSACAHYNFAACGHGAGRRATKKIGAVLYDYPSKVGSTPLVATTEYHGLSAQTVKHEIDNGRPIIAGVNTSGFVHGSEAEHAVLIVGYDDSSGVLDVVVNDPFDYAFYNAPNPWGSAGGQQIVKGQYEVPLDTWVTFMPWVDAIYNIHEKTTIDAYNAVPVPEPTHLRIVFTD